MRFLVVDDNEDIRDLLVRMVERLGHSAQPACDGVEAVEALAGSHYDVMLLDLSMPRMSGEDVMRWLREHPECATGTRVVVVSAWARDQRSTLDELGAHAVMTKPLRAQQLRALAAEVLSSGRCDATTEPELLIRDAG